MKSKTIKNKYLLLTNANCIASAIACVISAPFLIVMSCRILTLFEIRNDNLQVTVGVILVEIDDSNIFRLEYY